MFNFLPRVTFDFFFSDDNTGNAGQMPSASEAMSPRQARTVGYNTWPCVRDDLTSDQCISAFLTRLLKRDNARDILY